METKSTPRDFFIYLLSTITLYMSALGVIMLLFQFINAKFPDAVNPNYGLGDIVRWFVAMLVIVFPVYLWTVHTVNREREKDPAKSEIKVRKWLVNLTLFLAAGLVIGDMIALIYNFLQGELSVRFFLKVLSVLTVGVSVFSYYLFDLRRSSSKRTRNVAMMEWGAILAVILVIAGGLMVSGSPFSQRLVRFDQRKLGDLQSLRYQIESYVGAQGKLPDSLADLKVLGVGSQLRDPQNGKEYEYKKTGDLKFELCADFNLPSTEDDLSYRGLEPEIWKHEAGHQCIPIEFNKNVLEQRFPKPLPVPLPVD